LFTSIFASKAISRTTALPIDEHVDPSHIKAAERIHSALRDFTTLLAAGAEPASNRVTITRELDVLIDGEAVELSTALKRALFVLCLLGEKFTTERFARLYCNNTADPKHDFHTPLKRLREKALPYLAWSGRGDKEMAGVRFTKKASDTAIRDFLRTYYNTPAAVAGRQD